MKTLNRTLSLVLVLVMVLGLFGVASAKFNDDATIQYKEAVGVAVGIGAIDGYADGTFNPKGTITREEAAKLITYAILGADLAKTLTVSNTGFKDVAATRWSAPFITYLVNKGIINGMGDGTFDPTGKVTGYQLGKMLLTASGYGKNGEYTGNSWELNTAVDAGRLNIFKGSKATNHAAPATREEAALYVFNGIKVDQVIWDKTKEAYVDNDTATNIANDLYGYVAPAAVEMIKGAGKNAKNETTVLTNGASDGFVYTPALGLYGHNVKLHTNGADKVYYAEDLSAEYAVPATVTTAAALKTALAKFNGGTVVTYASAVSIPKITNSSYNATGYVTGNADIATANQAVNAGDIYVVYNNQVVAVRTVTTALEKINVVIDKDKNVTATIATGSVKIFDNTKTYVATNGTALNKIVYAGTIDWTSFVPNYDATSSVNQNGVAYFNCEGIGNADYATASKVALTDIVKVEGTAAAVNVAGNKLTVNGKSYDVDISDAGDEATGLYSTSTAFGANLLSGTYKFWFNNAGKIFYIQTVTASETGTYAPALVNAQWKVASGVDAYGVPQYKYYAQVVTSDGKVANYEIKTKDGLKPAEAAVESVSYEADDAWTANYWFALIDGNTVSLRTTSSTYAFGTAGEQTSIAKAQVLIGSDMYFTGNSAIVTVNDIAPGSAVAAADVKASSVAKSAMEDQTFSSQTVNVAYKTVSGTKVVEAVFVEGTYAGVASDVYFIAKYNGQISAGTTPTYSYTAYKVGSDTPVNLVSTTSTGASLVGTFKSIQTTAAGDSFVSASTSTLVASGAMAKVTANTRVVNDYYMTLTRGVVNKLATNAVVVDLRAAVVAGTATAYTTAAEIPAGTQVFAVYPGATSATQTSLATIFVVDGSSDATLSLKADGAVLTADSTAVVDGTNIKVALTTNPTLIYAAADYTLPAGATAVFADVDSNTKISANDTITVTALDGTVVVYKFVDSE